MNNLLKRVIGEAWVNQEDVITVSADCENITNSQTLIYMSKQEYAKPISMAMILKSIYECGIPNADAVEQIRIFVSSYPMTKQEKLPTFPC